MESATVAGATLDRYFHICAFFDSRDKEYDDLALLNGMMTLDVLRAHPPTFINGTVQKNFYYTPPDVLSNEVRQRRSYSAHAPMESARL